MHSHDLAWNLLMWGVGLGFVVEMFAYFAAPGLFAWAAVLPLGRTRVFKLSLKAREALSAEVAHQGGYREPVARPFELARASLPARIEIPGAIARVYPARGYVTVRAPYSLTDKTLAIARIGVFESDGVIELRARFLPMMALTLIALGPVAVVAAVATQGFTSETFGTLAFCAVFAAINLLTGYFFGRRRVEAAAERIAYHLEQVLTNARGPGIDP